MGAPKRLKDGGKMGEAPIFPETRCAVCKATWFEQPTADLANALCDRAEGAVGSYRDINGVKHPGLSGCPYKRD